MIIVLLILISLVCFIIFMILKYENCNYQKFCKYVLVLGARVLDKDTPCKALENRLIIAKNYLDKFKNSIVIVSGGKGKDEPLPEAVVMKNYLIKQNISEHRILIEDLSRNTFENLSNVKRLLRDENEILIITSGFHLFRARMLAKRVGFKKISLIGSHISFKSKIRNLCREIFAIIKSFFLDW